MNAYVITGNVMFTVTRNTQIYFTAVMRSDGIDYRKIHFFFNGGKNNFQTFNMGFLKVLHLKNYLKVVYI